MLAPLQSQDDEFYKQIQHYGQLRDEALKTAKRRSVRQKGHRYQKLLTISKRVGIQSSKTREAGRYIHYAGTDNQRQGCQCTKGSTIADLYQMGVIDKYDGAEARISALSHLGLFHWVITMLFINLKVLPLMI